MTKKWRKEELLPTR